MLEITAHLSVENKRNFGFDDYPRKQKKVYVNYCVVSSKAFVSIEEAM